MVLLLDSLRYIYIHKVDCPCYSLTISSPKLATISNFVPLIPSHRMQARFAPQFQLRALFKYPLYASTSRGPKLHVFNMHPVLIMKYLPNVRSHSVITWHDTPCKVLANRWRHCTAFLVKLILFHLSLFAHVL